ncbi:precorrin-2 C(20)-methyltransferase [Halorhodospira halochloris]|uniref:precorrin-2 C(20)-methyltransferase n=1 Tax=Halorhodospira halochloris TaxID=1052 RepID=UPI001EE99231|nr:precorrin-2 C(20)-methyltransferase [Halorhodospira halochloris]MCG5529872.1 precorrin-2 C(20)-methyltransferase [Halorhodospira halochloris]MCG5547616.1 precorrin-2 C(20)-methyltransferase [Halorhodospira halochloris]
MHKTGKLIGVSLGPGDPSWITRRAWEVLSSSAHWAYPVREAGQTSYALEIVRRGGLPVADDATELVFPMTHDAATLAKAWGNAAKQVCEKLHSGKDVAFLVEGDASTYATFSHLSSAVGSEVPDLEVETIPGVTSFNAAAARLGQPLVKAHERFAVLPAGYDLATVERLLPEFDTLVLLKVKPLLPELIDLLQYHNLDDNCAFVERAGTDGERIVTDPEQMRSLQANYLSLLLVRNPDRRSS